MYSNNMLSCKTITEILQVYKEEQSIHSNTNIVALLWMLCSSLYKRTIDNEAHGCLMLTRNPVTCTGNEI